MIEKITCKLGCINFYVNLRIGDYCCPPGLIPIPVREGTKCQRGYTQSDMDKILEQEEAENKILRQNAVLTALRI